MIIDKLSNAHLYEGIRPRLKMALDYLREHDLAELPVGEYEIDGNKVFIQIHEYETKASEEARFECHSRYADVQYIIRGEEKMGYTNIKNTKVVEEHKERDLFFLETEAEDRVLVKEGMFALFTPEDAHMPSMYATSPKPVKKAVVKVLWNE
ncbi:YhcH/YjgK/YiaL family protein [Bacillus sp. REN16]|uniref:YhcH/YjgK/YiaL family protein n=1 Tax=Bacillus sp. REN16 TaxID=2887296 RepID=UPI001E41B75E|nr:YhcH/YjgK/YiaL family protein [Bacillus sp. REN16]MCC3356149.1 YhcH/YjgK/YiaL family protein [Bacillus sp. REN16]